MSIQNIKNRTLQNQGLPVDGTSIVVLGGFLSVVPGGTFTPATSSALGAVRPDNTSITVTPTGGIVSVPLATSSAAGLVRPDNTSIAIAGSIMGLAPNPDFNVGLPAFGRTSEYVSSVANNTTSTLNLNIADAAIWYLTGNTTTVTVNFTNVPTTDNRVVSLTVILNQGATPRAVTSLQIAGATQTILWQGGTAPTPGTSKTDAFTFSLVRVSSSWSVLGAATSQG